MPGLCIKKNFQEKCTDSELKLVDLGGCAATGSFRLGVVAAAWVHSGDATQFRVCERPDRLLIVEGEPDRFPREDESVDSWLRGGRWGSFRGFEITGTRVLAFVDPLGTRPLWYLKGNGCFYVADRLSTLAVNLESPVVCWPVVLEEMVLNAVYSNGSTLEGAIRLQPGETLEFAADAVKSSGRQPLPGDPDVAARRVREDPGAALLSAMEKAVQETWSREDSWLLLSGGLDSRLTLALAGPGRKALTVTTRENTESRLARQIAEQCGAEFRHWPRPAEHYFNVLRNSVYLTGAMWDSNVAHHLGLGQEWRRAGIGAVTHAFLYDTLLKGWFTFLDQPYEPVNQHLYEVAGDLEICFHKRSGRGSEYAPDDVLGLLNDDGRQIAHEQLRTVVQELPRATEDGFNVTIERKLVESVSRQCHYPNLLGWIEELPVSSPIFHPALWSWYAHSRPADRYQGKALRKALRLLRHPVSNVIDSNTGAPVSSRRDWRTVLHNQPLYQSVRRVVHRIHKPVQRPALQIPQTDEGSWPHLAPTLRTPAGRRVLEEGISYLEGCTLFEPRAIDHAMARFLSGDDRWMEPAIAAMTAGRWLRLVSERRRSDPNIRTIAIAGATTVDLAASACASHTPS